MSDPRPSLKDKAILVTGAATGIGRATAELLAASGAKVFGIGLDGAAGAELAEASAASGSPILFREADVTEEDAVRGAVAAMLAVYGRIDGVVNSAGINQTDTRIEDMSDAEWDRTIAVNLTAIFRICRATLPEIRRAGGAASSTSPRSMRWRPSPASRPMQRRRAACWRCRSSSPSTMPATSSG